jgi:hypothetical protein
MADDVKFGMLFFCALEKLCDTGKKFRMHYARAVHISLQPLPLRLSITAGKRTYVIAYLLLGSREPRRDKSAFLCGGCECAIITDDGIVEIEPDA